MRRRISELAGGSFERARTLVGLGVGGERPASGSPGAAVGLPEPASAGFAGPRRVTLLNLVAELSGPRSEGEVVAAVMDLVDRRRVRLIGQFREEHIRDDPSAAGR